MGKKTPQVLKDNIYSLQGQVVPSHAGAQGDPWESLDSPVETAAAPLCSGLRTPAALSSLDSQFSSVNSVSHLVAFYPWHPVNSL